MIIQDTAIKDCKLIKPDVFYDFRGEYIETWQREYYKGIFPKDINTPEFVQDDFSVSNNGTLRGLHGDPDTWKLVQCPMGELLLGVLDIRDDSPTREEWVWLRQWSSLFERQMYV
jgi:dTDP-4-dehydrorhamnose 3,5-epimerase